MSASPPGNGQALPRDPERLRLCQLLRQLGAQPFHRQVVHSAWNTVVDVPELHQEVKSRILSVLSSCGQPEANRCLTVTAPPGYGKTHLLAWTRQQLDARDDAVFVYVPPYTDAAVPLEEHLLRATLEALRRRSQRQSRLFDQSVQKSLVLTFDAMARAGRLRDLGVKRRWLDFVYPGRHQIGSKGEQLPALQQALRKRPFVEQAFQDFAGRITLDAPGVQPDRECFIAAALLGCGHDQQRWHADRWFQNHPFPPAVWEPFHLTRPCCGLEKVRNSLFTLSRLVNQSLCLVFDQMEDTHTALENRGRFDAELRQMTLVLSGLSAMPRVCLLFMFQTSAWIQFRDRAPPMLRDRMIAGYGEQELPPLDASGTREVIRVRMEHAVWRELAPEGPPPAEPLFPFSEADVQQLRRDSGSELRGFLRRAGELYERLLRQVPGAGLPDDRPPESVRVEEGRDGGPRPEPRLDGEPAGDQHQDGEEPPEPPSRPKAPRIVLTGIEPTEVLRHEPRPIVLFAQHLPDDVEVFFGDCPAKHVACRPDQGQIDVTTPTGLSGEVPVCVRASEDPSNTAIIPLFFVEREVPSPHHQFIDGQMLQKRRRALRLNQGQVANQLGTSVNFLSALENGRNEPPDDVFRRLARIYRQPLASFLKDQS